jgi:hypothetical protein
MSLSLSVRMYLILLAIAFLNDAYVALLHFDAAVTIYGLDAKLLKSVTQFPLPTLITRIMGCYALGTACLSLYTLTFTNKDDIKKVCRIFSLTTGLATFYHIMDALDGESDVFNPLWRLYFHIAYAGFFTLWGIINGFVILQDKNMNSVAAGSKLKAK